MNNLNVRKTLLPHYFIVFHCVVGFSFMSFCQWDKITFFSDFEKISKRPSEVTSLDFHFQKASSKDSFALIDLNLADFTKLISIEISNSHSDSLFEASVIQSLGVNNTVKSLRLKSYFMHDFSKLKRLKHLSMNSGCFDNESIQHLDSLETLKVFDVSNSVSKTDYVFKLTNLKDVDLYVITSNFPYESIGNLKKLEGLSIYSRSLTNIPEEWLNLTQIEYLTLVSNRSLNDLENLQNMCQLTRLRLGSDTLSTLPSILRNLPLEYLRIDSHNDVIIPKSFLKYPIKQLDFYLHGNRISNKKLISKKKKMKYYRKEYFQFESRSGSYRPDYF